MADQHNMNETENTAENTAQDQPAIYWFNSDTGEILLFQEQLPQNKRHLYLVISREKLYFGTFAFQAKKRLKNSDILNIQGHFIPFKQDVMNFIYSTEKQKQKDKHFFFWVGTLPPDAAVESFFYDEIPESLVFKGNPEDVKNYDFFIFNRVSGFEILYYNVRTDDFYSVFEKEQGKLLEKLVLMLRKFGVRREDRFRILSEVEIPSLDRLEGEYTFDMRLIKSEEERYYFLPDFFPVKKTFSNLSQSKQIKNIRTIARQWSRNLTIMMILLLVVILANAWGFFQLKKDNGNLEQKFSEVGKLLSDAERIEFRLNKIKTKIAQYPDHMLYMKTIAESMDEESVLIGYSMGDGRILLEGYSSDSLGLLARLRKSNQFQDVRFKTTVTKNVYSQREKFEIEILLKTPGTKPEAETSG